MSATYCPSCYRDLPEGGMCIACAERQGRTRSAARLPLRIGLLGLPFLVFGILAPSYHACVVGAILAGCGTLAHVAVTLRSH